MKSETEIYNNFKDIILTTNQDQPGFGKEALLKMAAYAYQIQSNATESLTNFHNAAIAIAQQYIANPRVHSEISHYADNDKPHYHTQVWDGAQHIMCAPHQNKYKALKSFQNACEIRWGKPMQDLSFRAESRKDKTPKRLSDWMQFDADMKEFLQSLPYPPLVRVKQLSEQTNDTMLFSCI